jgi:hypothetical protein
MFGVLNFEVDKNNCILGCCYADHPLKKCQIKQKTLQVKRQANDIDE